MQMIVFILFAVFLSLVSYIYFYKTHRKYGISMAVIMVVLLIAYAIMCRIIGLDDWIFEASFFFMIALTFPLAFIDAMEKKIPNEFVVTGLVIQLGIYTITLIIDTNRLLTNLKSSGIALIIAVVFCVLGMIIVKNGIGMGDVKLLLVIAIMGGMENFISILFFTMVVAFFMGIFELIIKKKGKDASIPFAPAIFAGTLICSVLTIFAL